MREFASLNSFRTIAVLATAQIIACGAIFHMIAVSGLTTLAICHNVIVYALIWLFRRVGGARGVLTPTLTPIAPAAFTAIFDRVGSNIPLGVWMFLKSVSLLMTIALKVLTRKVRFRSELKGW
ncbi:hypothetical protein [Rhizobium lusitanum]|uniref:hypothetical protein n=1 Tax=Rhizobium lusitanum TaxID=293958 RepID=UPI001574378F|nr:hypothetical protein [Rhizobium lusitanum]NTJ11790.1 hypothetical protein [Rhizobium lusitanum]